ncbi:hypothetical protein [Nocardia sp. NBC_00416]|uniref:hypothetical protein n=1 Tax=Nocardia sp. NBC_00416 TaxID=2975991 RepID=UPI002E22C194
MFGADLHDARTAERYGWVSGLVAELGSSVWAATAEAARVVTIADAAHRSRFLRAVS